MAVQLYDAHTNRIHSVHQKPESTHVHTDCMGDMCESGLRRVKLNICSCAKSRFRVQVGLLYFQHLFPRDNTISGIDLYVRTDLLNTWNGLKSMGIIFPRSKKTSHGVIKFEAGTECNYLAIFVLEITG